MCVTYANKPICFGWEDPYIQAVASRLHDHNVHAVTPFAPCFREYGTVAKPSNAFG
jgi:hypothetical protein